MEAWRNADKALEYAQEQCYYIDFVNSAVARLFCSIFRTLLTHSYCADWTVLIEDYGLFSKSLEGSRLREVSKLMD